MFHSFSKTHSGIPEAELRRRQEMGIERFILSRSDDYLERYEIYCKWLRSRRNIRLLKYEDMIASPEKWLSDFLSATGRENMAMLDELVKRHVPDLDPAGAKEGTHKRKMLPG